MFLRKTIKTMSNKELVTWQKKGSDVDDETRNQIAQEINRREKRREKRSNS